MTAFTSDLAPQFHDRLMRREADLLAALAREESEERAALRQSDAQEVTDFKELAQEQTDLAVHGMQHDHAQRELGLVRSALQRLAQGSYGLCESCGDPIELRRLEALPYAARCMRCQSESERQG